MPSAIAEISPTPLAPMAPLSWPQRFATLDRTSRLRWGAALALLLVGLTAAFFYTRQPDYRVLYSNLSEKDGGSIVAQLAQMNVPYRYTEGGAAILVPADRVHDVRLRLASQGLPKGSVAGFELMDNSRFGVTQFQERLNFQRGLEGELTRSIEALDVVQGARVHLALPNQNGFFREQQKPTASVLVHLHPGRFLDRTQLAGIVHLVASSVPEMAPQAVSVLDDTGRLLSQTPEGSADSAVDAQQLAYVQQMEQHYIRRIVDILEPIVGKDNVRAQVTADVDFSHTESTIEQHKPNQTPDAAAVRSQQILESSGETQEAPPSGIPGAVSNQPPQNATAPINGANPAPTAGSAQGGEKIPAKRESITNYEVDKTTQVTRGASAAVRRVTAAVVVNATAATALTPEQIEQMTALVREAIGFQQARGDSVNVMNAPFQLDGSQNSDLPFWQRPEALALAKTWGWPIGLSLAAALLLLGLLRPMLKARAAAAEAKLAAKQNPAQLDAIEGDVLERPALPAPVKEELPPTPEQLRLEDARVLAKENPVAVAHILKTWVNGE